MMTKILAWSIAIFFGAIMALPLAFGFIFMVMVMADVVSTP